MNQVNWKKNMNVASDEPPHQMLSYTLLFLLFLYFLYIVDPPLCTPALMQLHTITLALISLDQSRLFDGYMFYDSHVLFLFLVTPTCTLPQSNQSQTLALHGQALTIASLWMSLMPTFLFAICINLPVFTFHSREEPDNLPIQVSPRIEI